MRHTHALTLAHSSQFIPSFPDYQRVLQNVVHHTTTQPPYILHLTFTSSYRELFITRFLSHSVLVYDWMATCSLYSLSVPFPLNQPLWRMNLHDQTLRLPRTASKNVDGISWIEPIMLCVPISLIIIHDKRSLLGGNCWPMFVLDLWIGHTGFLRAEQGTALGHEIPRVQKLGFFRDLYLYLRCKKICRQLQQP